MKITFLLLVFLTISILFSCSKENRINEDETDAFKSKFFFLWNGIPFYDTLNDQLKLEISCHLFNGNFLGCRPQLKLKKDIYTYETIFHYYFSIQPFRRGFQEFKTNQYQAHLVRYNDLACGDYLVVKKFPHTMEINKIDTVNQIVRGYFAFTAANKCQDTVHVTKGYFHIKYKIAG